MKNLFKKNKKPYPTQTAPRALPDIEKAYQELLAKAAQAQYLAYVHNKDLEGLNEALVSVNQEAALRNELDRQAKKETENVKT